MGTVYEAVQLRLNKRVAVKIMSRELAANTLSLARFHREAEITSRLGHPHLVTVIDFGTAASGEPYLVMELLDGEDLEMRLVKVGRLSLEAAVRITRQAASALGAAHAQGVVHRDMKPANIFLLHVPGEEEFVKVLDFGISKMQAARIKLTHAAAVIGTPLFMSPEQTMGKVEDTDHRADQWALACIAWEMLSGRAPFDGDEVATLFHQINCVDPPPLELNGAEAIPGVESVLRKALSKQVAERYPTIRGFAYALETAAFGRSAEATPGPQAIPRQVLAEASSRHRPGQAAIDPAADTQPTPTQRQDAGFEADGNSVPASVQPFPLHDAVARTSPIRSRPFMATASAAGLVLLVAAIFLLRAPRAAPITQPSAAPVPPAAQAKVIALPPTRGAANIAAPPVVFPLAATTVAKQIAPSKQAKVTPTRDSDRNATSENTLRRKATKVNRTIFQEL